MNETIVIYHGGCRDGFCAAWVYNKWFNQTTYETSKGEPNVTYHPGFYGQEPPDVKDKDVVILDFCYPLEDMKMILGECNSLTWLDHHKTAQPVCEWFDSITDDRFRFIFDNNRSGAGIAWDYFFPNEPRPWLVDYVEDRDLWNTKLNFTKMINSYISALEFDFDVWDRANMHIKDSAIEMGGAILLKTEQYIREVCKNVYFANIRKAVGDDEFDGAIEYENIPTVNICQVDCSEVLHELCKLYPSSDFSLYWFKRHDGMYQYGLRSIGDFDVSQVAKLFGGGGHHNAAGFQLSYLLNELK
jgi:uncharacterized protein